MQTITFRNESGAVIFTHTNDAPTVDGVVDTGVIAMQNAGIDVNLMWGYDIAPASPLTTAKFQVLLDGENVWTIDGAPWVFDSYDAAAAELAKTFRDMDDAGMDYAPSDYCIEEIKA